MNKYKYFGFRRDNNLISSEYWSYMFVDDKIYPVDKIDKVLATFLCITISNTEIDLKNISSLIFSFMT